MRKKREEIREEREKLTNSLTSPIVDGGIEAKYDNWNDGLFFKIFSFLECLKMTPGLRRRKIL